MRVLVAGTDVIHSWYVPPAGVQEYAVVGHVNESWFQFERTGYFVADRVDHRAGRRSGTALEFEHHQVECDADAHLVDEARERRDLTRLAGRLAVVVELLGFVDTEQKLLTDRVDRLALLAHHVCDAIQDLRARRRHELCIGDLFAVDDERLGEGAGQELREGIRRLFN